MSKIRIVAAVGLTLFLASCALFPTSVGDILDDPEQYFGQTVRLIGLIVSQDPGDSDEFQFNDGTGDITLDFQSSGPFPAVGDLIMVTGIVASGPEIDVDSFRKLR